MKMIFSGIYFFFAFSFFNFVAGETYEGLLTGMAECSDFENKKLKTNELVMEVSEDGEGMRIGGFIGMEHEIDDSCDAMIKVTKETETGNQAMFSSRMNLCGSIKDTNAPWYTIVEKMNITECPVKVGKYGLGDSKIDMDFAKDILNHDYVGDYIVNMAVVCDLDQTFSCHDLGVCIVEHDDDDE